MRLLTLTMLLVALPTALITVSGAVAALLPAALVTATSSPWSCPWPVSAAACFLTLVATPANLTVRAPGGYRFGDYCKLRPCSCRSSAP